MFLNAPAAAKLHQITRKIWIIKSGSGSCCPSVATEQLLLQETSSASEVLSAFPCSYKVDSSNWHALSACRHLHFLCLFELVVFKGTGIMWELSETAQSHQKSDICNLCMWALCPGSKKSVGKSDCQFSSHEQNSPSIFHHVRNGSCVKLSQWNSKNLSNNNPKNNDLSYHRRRTRMKNDFWLR